MCLCDAIGGGERKRGGRPNEWMGDDDDDSVEARPITLN